MPATKRRYNPVSRSPSPEIKDKEETNSLLISACVKILSRAHPKGMTSKELSAELQGDSSLPSNLSSTTLSSRLNGLFRKYHGDGHEPTEEQLSSLPIRRETSADLPKRLVYTYCKASGFSPEANEPVTPPADDDIPGPITKKQRLADVISVEADKAPEEISFSSPVSHAPSENNSFSASSDGVPDLEATSQGEGVDVSDTSSELSDTQAPPAHDIAITEPTETLASILARIPSISGRPPNKVNLYYDALGTEALSAVLNSSCTDFPSWNLDLTSEFISPESVALDDLDSLLV